MSKCISLLMIVGLILSVTPTNAQDQCGGYWCGDVDQDGNLGSLDDFGALLGFLEGDPVPADSQCLEFDDRVGITVADLSLLLGSLLWCEGHVLGCGATGEYEYPQSTIDTFHIPARSYIPEDQQRVELPVRAYFQITDYSRGCIPFYYVPLIALGDGSNDCFVLDSVSTGDIFGDTALAIGAIHGNELIQADEVRTVLTTLSYVRVTPGIGRIRPQYVDTYNGRRSGQASRGPSWSWDIYQPVIKEEADCCQGLRGNVSNDPGDIDDVSDLTMMVNYLFVDFEPLPCFDEADVNANGVIDISDLTQLINCLFVTFEPCGAPCPTW